MHICLTSEITSKVLLKKIVRCFHLHLFEARRIQKVNFCWRISVWEQKLLVFQLWPQSETFIPELLIIVCHFCAAIWRSIMWITPDLLILCNWAQLILLAISSTSGLQCAMLQARKKYDYSMSRNFTVETTACTAIYI